MNAAWLAAAWAGIGVMAGLGPARLRRPIALIAPLLLVALSIATVQGGARPEELGGGGLALPREAAGLLAASAAALWLCLLLADRLDGRELIGIGTVGGAVVLLLSTGSPLLFGVAAMLAVAALSLRWISVAPGRASLATARVAGTGAAALIAVSLLLPAVSPDGQPGMVGGLLVVGVLALAAVMPLGGWAVGALSDVPAPEIATWLVLLAPAVLLSAFAIPAPLPLLARLAFEHTILACGLISAIWAGVMSLRAGPATRYGRVALGDLGLVAAGVGTGEAAAVAGGLLLILTHLVVAPILLQRPRPGLGPPRRLVWLAICGLPPSPAFWGRFLILQACVAFSSGVAVACLVAGGLVTVTAVLSVAQGEPGEGAPAPHHRVVAAWVLAALALAVGLLPMGAVHLVFGPGA
jgi:formate hydrogenlyase subunit 3/multisubunit Na+/H+ antiporter MnhD subunit